jgi:hypothetical protein
VADVLAFKGAVDTADFRFATAQWAQAKDFGVIGGQDNPISFADANQRTNWIFSDLSGCHR